MNPDLNYPDDTHSGEIKEENREDNTSCYKQTIVGQNGRFLGRLLGKKIVCFDLKDRPISSR